MRILQLTLSAIVCLVVSGVSFFVIESWSGGRLERWQAAPLTGSVGEECLAIELAMVPLVLGVLACWGVVRLFRMRSIQNEVHDTFSPILTVSAGYGRFVPIVVSGVYLVLGYGWAALAHLAIAVLAFAVFYGTYRARERALHERLPMDGNEDEEAAQLGAPPNGGPDMQSGNSGVREGRHR